MYVLPSGFVYAHAQMKVLCYIGCSGTTAGENVGWTSPFPRGALLTAKWLL